MTPPRGSDRGRGRGTTRGRGQPIDEIQRESGRLRGIAPGPSLSELNNSQTTPSPPLNLPTMLPEPPEETSNNDNRINPELISSPSYHTPTITRSDSNEDNQHYPNAHNDPDPMPDEATLEEKEEF